MVKLSTPVALLAVAVAGAFAQAPASSAASSAAGAGSSAAAPAQSSEAPPSSASPSASPSQAAGGGGGGSGGSSSAVCSALFNPSVSQVNCQESSTVVPPYNRTYSRVCPSNHSVVACELLHRQVLGWSRG